MLDCKRHIRGAYTRNFNILWHKLRPTMLVRTDKQTERQTDRHKNENLGTPIIVTSPCVTFFTLGVEWTILITSQLQNNMIYPAFLNYIKCRNKLP